MNKRLRQFRRHTRADTVAQCNLILIEHLDGKHISPFDGDAPPHSHRRGYFLQLITWGFLSCKNGETVLTDLGRRSLAETLAEMADTLMRYRRKRKTKRNLRLAALSLAPTGLQPTEIAQEHKPPFFTEMS